MAMVLGVYVASALYLLFTVGLVARHRLRSTLGVSLGFPLVLFVLFEYVFLTPLLKGPLETGSAGTEAERRHVRESPAPRERFRRSRSRVTTSC